MKIVNVDNEEMYLLDFDEMASFQSLRNCLEYQMLEAFDSSNIYEFEEKANKCVGHWFGTYVLQLLEECDFTLEGFQKQLDCDLGLDSPF